MRPTPGDGNPHSAFERYSPPARGPHPRPLSRKRERGEKLPPLLVGEGWGGGAALAPALIPDPVTPGILPSALRARLRRFEIRSRRICPQAGEGREAVFTLTSKASPAPVHPRRRSPLAEPALERLALGTNHQQCLAGSHGSPLAA